MYFDKSYRRRFMRFSLQTAAAALAATAVCAQTTSLVQHSAVENQVVHHQQETYPMPSGWKATDLYVWHNADEGVPAVLTQTHMIQSSDGKSIISWEHDVTAAWISASLSNGMGVNTQNSRGIRAADTGSEMFVNLFRQRHPGLDVTVVSHADTPCPSMNAGLVANARPVPGGLKPEAAAYSSMVIYTYTLNGVPTVHLSYGIYDRLNFVSTNDGTFGSRGAAFASGNWIFRQDTNVIAPRAQFSALCALAQNILPAVKVDSVWQKGYERVVDNRIRQLSARIQGNINASRNSTAYASTLALRDANRQTALNDAFREQQDQILRTAPNDVK